MSNVRGSERFVRALVVSIVLIALVAACGGGKKTGGNGTPTVVPTPGVTKDATCSATVAVAAPGNALKNGGFESGPDPWASLTTPDWGRAFVVSQQKAHSGANSAYLQLRSEDGGATRVYGVVQEITPGALPDTLSGYYYVDKWEKGTPRQYLQFAIIVTGATNLPASVVNLGASNHQIRYILAGVDTQPTNIANSKYVLVSKDPPKVGQWVHFERNIRQDFCNLWGSVPYGFSDVRVFFETRWDERAPTDGPSSADVYYDDLYWGPAAGAPP
jgi:hypothetical protein